MMKASTRWWICTLLLLLVTISYATADCLYGKIYYLNSNNPLQNYSLVLRDGTQDNATTTTNGSGHYTFGTTDITTLSDPRLVVLTDSEVCSVREYNLRDWKAGEGSYSAEIIFDDLTSTCGDQTRTVTESQNMGVGFEIEMLENLKGLRNYLMQFHDRSVEDRDEDGLTGDNWTQHQCKIYTGTPPETTYRTNSETIRLQSLHVDDDVVLHEYGHFVTHHLDPWLWLADCGRDHSKDEPFPGLFKSKCAYGEGLADYLVISSKDDDLRCSNDWAPHGPQTCIPFESHQVEGLRLDIAQRYEVISTKILWDIADTKDSDDFVGPAGVDDDPIEGEAIKVWNVIREKQPSDILKFFNAWREMGPSYDWYSDQLYEVYRLNNLSHMLDYTPNPDSNKKNEMYKPEGPSNSWPTYRHTYARTGSTFLRGNLDAGSIVQGWSYDEAANGTAFLDSPVVADIDGDGNMEILITASAPTLNRQDRIYALKRQPDKTWKQLWKYPEVYDNVEVYSIWGAPAVADILNNDGIPEVAFSTSGGQVFLLDANTGRPAKGWRRPFQVPEKPCGGGTNCTGSIQSVSMVDIDDDGHLELVFADMVYASEYGGFVSHIYVVNATSKYQRHKWSASAYGPEGALAFADIDADGKLEIVSPSLTGLWVADDDGDELYRYFTKRTLYDTPAIADIDGNGVYDIIYTTAAEECTSNCAAWTWDNYTYRVDKDGNVLGSYHHTWFANVDPAIGDLDSNKNDLEIATGENRNLISNFYDYPWTSPYSGKLVILDTDMTKLCDFTDSNQMDEIYASPVIADIDNDNTNEVIFGTRNGTVYVVRYGGSSTCNLEWKKSLAGSVWSSPVIADVDGDGYAEIIVKHDAVINNPTMVAEAYREFGHITSGNETLSFNPLTGRLYGLFDHKPERPVPEMMREAMMGFRAMTSSSSTLTALDADNQKPELDYIPSIRALEGDLVNISASATDPDNDTMMYYYTPPFGSNGQWQTTAYNSSGTYEILATASDGNLTDSQFVTLEVFRADATNLTVFNDSSAVVFVIVFNTIPSVRSHYEQRGTAGMAIHLNEQDKRGRAL